MTRLVYPIIITVLSILVIFFAVMSMGGSLFNFGIGEETKTVSTHNVVLEKVEQMGKLQVVKYKFRDVMEYKIEYKWWPDSKAVLIISGEATGCVDLEKVKASDIQEQGDTLYLRLPEPELCDYKVNHEESKIYNTRSFSMDRTKLIGQAFQAAESQIKKTALESNILDQARKNAELTLKPLFQELSKKKVIFTYALNTEDTHLEKR